MENNKKRASGIYDFASVLVSAIIAVTFIFTFLFKISSVNGPSMLDSFHNGDRVFITAAGYQPKYGDVVIISQPNQYNEVLIKRIIAVKLLMWTRLRVLLRLTAKFYMNRI